ncbi:hypothetical protein H0H93_009729 [Arthromyces matolae]|nr:hypothetical protein H0H93_009729 [Arthromyces matolae]
MEDIGLNDPVLSFASNVQISIPRMGNNSNLGIFLQNLVNLAQHLKFERTGHHKLPRNVAELLQNYLISWKAEVASVFHRPGVESPPAVQKVIAEIATCRNIVQMALQVSPNPLPGPIQFDLQQLVLLVPGGESNQSERLDAIIALGKLHEHLQAVTFTSWVQKSMIDDQLETFWDWVDVWHEGLTGKNAARNEIKKCDRLVARMTGQTPKLRANLERTWRGHR